MTSKVAVFAQTVLADAAYDIKVQRDARVIFKRLERDFAKFVGAHQRNNQDPFTTREALSNATNKHFSQYKTFNYAHLPPNSPVRRGSKFTFSTDVFYYDVHHIVGRDSPYSNMRIVLNLGENTQYGGLYVHGYKVSSDMIILAFAPKPEKIQIGDDKSGQFVISLLSVYNDLISKESTFIHEFAHFDDATRALVKSPGKGDRSSSPDHEKDMGGYINHHKEINARYSEWVFAILDYLSRLLSVKLHGVKHRFSNFKDFWREFWDSGMIVPHDLRQYADEKTKKRLARRLTKFYDFLCQQPNLPKKVSVGLFVKRQLASDPLEGDPQEVDAKYELTGPRVGERMYDWHQEHEVYKAIIPPPKPKAAPPAPAEKPEGPQSFKTGRPPPPAKKAPPKDEDEQPTAEDEDESPPKEKPDKPAAKRKLRP